MDIHQLVDYFNGNLTNADLPQILGSDGPIVIDADEPAIRVTPDHLCRICDAVLAGIIQPDALESIGSCIIVSDLFEYDTDTESGDRVSDVVFCWENPMVNYQLNLETTVKFKVFLETGQKQFTEEDQFLDRHGKRRD